MRCPCRKMSQSLTYEACCGPIHRGVTTAATAEALMRARYAAYALGEQRFVLETWDPATRPARLDLPANLQWISLRINAAVESGDDATVSFEARGKEAGRTVVLAETSRFRRLSGRWHYVDGEQASPEVRKATSRGR